MTQSLNPFSGRQFLDSNGDPYVGAKLFVYLTGTSTKATVTKDKAGLSNHTNPIILNARGEPADGAGTSQLIWQTPGQTLKMVLAPADDTDPPVSAISTWEDADGTPKVSQFMSAVLDDTTSNAALTTLTVTRSETGATALPVLTELRKEINAFNFLSESEIADVQSGALSVDVTSGIQNAVYAAENSDLFLPAGKYLISGTIRIKTGTTIRGAGRRATVFVLDSSFPAADVAFRNETQTGALNAYYDSDIDIVSVGFDGSGITRTNSLFHFDKAKHVSVRDCLFTNHRYIVLAMAANKNVSVKDNWFIGNGIPKPTTTSSPCIWSDSGAWGTPYGLEIEGNRFYNNEWSCAYFMPSGGSFSHNVCIGNGESGVFTNNHGYNLRYIGNHIEGQIRSNISGSGIETGGNQLTISDNVLIGNASDGISITDSENVNVHDNIILNNGQESAYFTLASGIGIYTLSGPTPDHLNIHDNRIGDRQGVKTQYAGISVYGSGAAIWRTAIHHNDLTEQKTGSIVLSSGKFGPGSYTHNNYDKSGNLQLPYVAVTFQTNAGTGNQAVTGIGFRPRVVEIVATEAGAVAYQSFGTSDGVSETGAYISGDGAGHKGAPVGRIIDVRDSAGTARCQANLASLDYDGFTINITTAVTRPWCVAKCFP